MPNFRITSAIEILDCTTGISVSLLYLVDLILQNIIQSTNNSKESADGGSRILMSSVCYSLGSEPSASNQFRHIRIYATRPFYTLSGTISPKMYPFGIN